MGILEVLLYPDPRLRRKAKPVAEVSAEVAKFAEDLLETMYQHRGIGLAATQVGVEDRVLVIDTRPRDDKDRYTQEGMTELEKQVEQPLVVINPEIVAQEGESSFDEGCLSIPGYFETVKRPEYVEVKALNAKGEEVYIKTDGLLATCLQHEIDHLDGKLFIDRLSVIRANRLKNKIKKNGYPEPEDEDADAEAKANKDQKTQDKAEV